MVSGHGVVYAAVPLALSTYHPLPAWRGGAGAAAWLAVLKLCLQVRPYQHRAVGSRRPCQTQPACCPSRGRAAAAGALCTPLSIAQAPVDTTLARCRRAAAAAGTRPYSFS